MSAPFIVVRHLGRPGNRRTEFLIAGEQAWSSSREAALEFPTWRKARNAAARVDGFTAPAASYPVARP
jgi:hypothetical protein